MARCARCGRPTGTAKPAIGASSFGVSSLGVYVCERCRRTSHGLLFPRDVRVGRPRRRRMRVG
jgi:DNA-directed RNA polymerase subunit RPC12/RpoP